MQTASLLPESVLVPSKCCVVREQGEGWLFYNSRTDELHLVPPTGVVAYQLCDGLNSVNDINEVLSRSVDSDAATLRETLYTFFAQLVSRGILEVDHVG